MIIGLLLSLCTGIVQLLFSFVSLPQMPESVTSTMNTYFGYIFDNLDFLSFFVNVSTLKIVATVAILLFGFEHVVGIIMWIIHKIPLSID